MASVRTLADEVDSLSPFAGKGREMHRLVARAANADGLVVISPVDLARTVGVTKVNAQRWVWKMALPEGYLELVVDRRSINRPSTFRVIDPRKLIEG